MNRTERWNDMKYLMNTPKDILALDMPLSVCIDALRRSGRAAMRHDGIAPAVLARVGDDAIGDIDDGWLASFTYGMLETQYRKGRCYSPQRVADQLRLLGTAIRALPETSRMGLPAPELPCLTEWLPDGWRERPERAAPAWDAKAMRRRLAKLGTERRLQWAGLIALALDSGAQLQELLAAKRGHFELGNSPRWGIALDHEEPRWIPISNKTKRAVAGLLPDADPGSGRVFHLLGSPREASAEFRNLADGAGMHGFRFLDLRRIARDQKNRLDE